MSAEDDERTDKRWLHIRAIRDEVLGVRVARGFARLCDLALISRADIYDPVKNPTGTQRDLSPKHAKDAYEYISREDLAFWPEIFLAVRDQKVIHMDFADDETYGNLIVDIEKASKSKTIAISRVDGNHRLHYADGLTDGFPKIEKVVSFCVATDLTLNEEIKLFRDINNNQRRMNTSHLDNIKVRIEGIDELARRDPHLYIAKRLADDNDSPLYGLVYEGGKKEIHRIIPLRTLRTGVEYMLSRPTRLTALEDVDVKTKLIKHYFFAVRDWQPNALEKAKRVLNDARCRFLGHLFSGSGSNRS